MQPRARAIPSAPAPANSDYRHIRGAKRERLVDGQAQCFIAVQAPKQQNLDHGSRAVLPATALLQVLPEAVEAFRPAALRAPLLQRHRSGERSWFLGQHVQLMLKVQHFLLPAEASFMASYTFAFAPDLHIRRINFRLHLRSRR